MARWEAVRVVRAVGEAVPEWEGVGEMVPGWERRLNIDVIIGVVVL